ncbi:10945_t:CDS:1, partial [Cetraspora pellucida]
SESKKDNKKLAKELGSKEFDNEELDNRKLNNKLSDNYYDNINLTKLNKL